MCRLFALHAGSHDAEADFWLREAPTSLAAQSEVDADGFAIAALSADVASLDRQTLSTEPPRHPMVLSGRAERSQAYERDD